jgi:hypothetical protein
VEKAQRAHQFNRSIGWMVGTAQVRLCPPL